jgi:hypothetical protein
MLLAGGLVLLKGAVFMMEFGLLIMGLMLCWAWGVGVVVSEIALGWVIVGILLIPLYISHHNDPNAQHK